MKERREREDKERAERNEKWTEKVNKRAKEDEEWLKMQTDLLIQEQEKSKEIVITTNCGCALHQASNPHRRSAENGAH